jgi:hypothetical protein
MGASTHTTRRIIRRLIAALAVSDVAYRLLIREPVRRSLGINARQA